MERWSDGIAWLGIVVAVLVFTWIGLFVSRRFHRLKWQGAAGVYVGIVVGVIVDVMISSVFEKVDRNLFPFEIVMWWVVATGPLLFASFDEQQNG